VRAGFAAERRQGDRRHAHAALIAASRAAVK
jgi:hypothetical protein